MRYLTADYIFPVHTAPVEKGILTIDNDGLILDLESPNSLNIQHAKLEHFKGVICPGFVNTHCHLELSHMRGKMTEKAGMTGFIREILTTRGSFSPAAIPPAIEAAEKEMIQNGIVAVGDISNTSDTFSQKAKGNLYYHTFLEVFSLDPAKADDMFGNGLRLKDELSNIPHLKSRVSIVPHAPYTMSEKLLGLINEEAGKNKSILTIHNQESEEENELFVSRSGRMFEMFKTLGINPEFMQKTGKASLESTLPFLNNASKLLLVHNTYTNKKDIDWLKSNIKDLLSKIYFCTCPNANLYIENKLPDYKLFMEEGLNITVGTDSLASNWGLSILDELKTISKHKPQIGLQTLLTWATKNGAEFLESPALGTLEKGKKPGLNLLKNLDGLQLTSDTTVEKLI